MPAVPAICPNGHVFESGIVIESVRQATFVGSRSQCPKCGAMGVIPDGLYDALDETISVVAASDYSREQLEWVAAWLERARSERMDAASLADALEERSPELAGIVRRYLVPGNAAEVYALVTLLATLIGIWLMLHPREPAQPGPPPPPPARQQQLVEEAVAEAMRQP